MKRVLTFLAIMLLPLSVWAMTPVTDSDLADVTGQAGVNINADLTMDINIGTMAWGDDDGVSDYWTTYVAFPEYPDGGFVGVNGLFLDDLQIRARTEVDDNFNGYSTFGLKPITIDVATDTVYDAIAGRAAGTGTTFVRFGLGALQISLTSMTLDIALGDYVAAGNAVVLDQSMGSVNLSDMDIYINPLAYVDIYSHTGQGVNFTMNVIIDRFELGYVSWGDSDGVAGYDTDGAEWITGPSGIAPEAGYVGLNGLALGDADDYGIAITGNVAIDVVSSTAGIYAILPYALESWRGEAAYNPLNPDTTRLAVIYNFFAADPTAVTSTDFGPVPSITAVHISFPGGMNVNIGALRSQVAISNVPNLAAGLETGVMGDIYLQQMGISIADGSWVDIWAH